MRLASAAIALVAAAGPATGQVYVPASPPADAASVRPQNFRPAIAAELGAALRDRSSVRDPFISQPFVRWMGAANRYVVCVRFNARNGFGGFTGARDVMAVFVSGRLNSLIPAEAGECRNVGFEPFPELKR